MPPRKPVVSPRTPAPRAAAPRTTASAMLRAAGEALPAPSSARTGKLANISPYPDLAMAISMLQRRAGHVTPERKALLEKWIVTLTRLQNEMTRLRKLERLSDNLSQPHQGDLPL